MGEKPKDIPELDDTDGREHFESSFRARDGQRWTIELFDEGSAGTVTCEDIEVCTINGVIGNAPFRFPGDVREWLGRCFAVASAGYLDEVLFLDDHDFQAFKTFEGQEDDNGS